MGRRSPGNIARRQWPLRAGLSCFEAASMFPWADQRSSAAREIPGIAGRIPGMSESAFDAWALEGAANGPATDAAVVASAVPGATTFGMPPSSTTYPRPTSYPGSPPPVIFPNTRPVIMPDFRLHRHRHWSGRGQVEGIWAGCSELCRWDWTSELRGMEEHPGAAPGSAANKAGLCWRLAPPWVLRLVVYW